MACAYQIMENILRVQIIAALLLLSGGCFSIKQGKALQTQTEQLQKQVKELESSSTADRDRQQLHRRA